MRSELGKECRKLFRKLMAVEFSDYKEDKDQVIPQGWYVWKRQHQSGLFFWIFLVIDQKRDQFTAEAGWSFDATRPPWTMVSRKETEIILSKPLAFRTSRLWCQDNWGYWWKLVLRPEEFERAILYKDDPIEQCLPSVAPAVWEAGEKLKEFAIPVLKKLCESMVQPVQNNFRVFRVIRGKTFCRWMNLSSENVPLRASSIGMGVFAAKFEERFV